MSVQTPIRLFAAAICLSGLVAAAMPPTSGTGVVAADHPAASRAGAEILERGGNAVDAAVAAALSAGVVQPAGSGLGGGGFAVVRLAGEGTVVADFRERAPAAASRDMYKTADGGVAGSRKGTRAVAVPGESRGLGWLVRHHGRLPHRVVAAPAIRQASQGFPVGFHLAGSLSRTKDGQVTALFGRPAIGDLLKNTGLAVVLKRWAATGGEDLHTGASARAVAAKLSDGGLVTASDLADYEVKHREPIAVDWRGYTIHTMPPPSSGGVVLAQALKVLEQQDLKQLGHNSADYLHLLVEAMKHGYADRAHHLGDPDFVEVPIERLLSEERIAEIRGAVWPGRTWPPDHYGPLIAPDRDAGTQHISVIDAEGGATALTTTINTSFGSGEVVQSLGLVLNNEMDDFAAAPGVPNAYGLVGNEANSIAPGKRPLSSMTPTVVFDGEGDVVLVVGASGGSRIISATLQVLLNVLVFDIDPQEAVSLPRVHHQWQPDVLVAGHGISPDTVRALQARGHKVMGTPPRSQCNTSPEYAPCYGAVQAVARKGSRVEGGSDPDKGGVPAAIRP